jgi:hypothetical protein
VINAASGQNEIAFRGIGNVMDEAVFQTALLNFRIDFAIIARVFQQLIAVQRQPFARKFREFFKASLERV